MVFNNKTLRRSFVVATDMGTAAFIYAGDKGSDKISL